MSEEEGMREKLIDELLMAGIHCALAVIATEPQRRAFIAGYNGYPPPVPSSRIMAQQYARGRDASALFNPARASNPLPIEKE